MTTDTLPDRPRPRAPTQEAIIVRDTCFVVVAAGPDEAHLGGPFIVRRESTMVPNIHGSILDQARKAHVPRHGLVPAVIQRWQAIHGRPWPGGTP